MRRLWSFLVAVTRFPLRGKLTASFRLRWSLGRRARICRALPSPRLLTASSRV